ncbi:MAG: hypothetical protein IT380_12765 [Myxococcales bacterium]|nr:hypothetical protein [Myxococcales bacterium]
MKRAALASCALSLVFALSGCATTKIVSTWKDPEAKPLIKGEKVCAVVISGSPTLRRTAEDELVRLLADGTQAYRLFNDNEVKDRELVKQRLTEQGFKYVVVMKVEGVSQETQARLPGKDPVWNAYGAMWGDTTVVSNTTTVEIDTKIYNVEDGKLVWIGTSESVDPSKVEQLVDDVAKAVGEKLKADGMLVSAVQ